MLQHAIPDQIQINRDQTVVVIVHNYIAFSDSGYYVFGGMGLNP